MNDMYLRTARLLVQVAPSVFVDDMFALKGGTAINLFYRDLPRLSVDLDLVFRDHTVPRSEALRQIDAGVRAMSARLRARGYATREPVTLNSETKLVVERDGVLVKVAGMTSETVPLEQLHATRTRMMHELQTGLDASERSFLLSLVRGAPEWDVLGVPHLSMLPAVQWKLLNLQKLQRENPRKFEEQHDRLGELLASAG